MLINTRKDAEQLIADFEKGIENGSVRREEALNTIIKGAMDLSSAVILGKISGKESRAISTVYSRFLKKVGKRKA